MSDESARCPRGRAWRPQPPDNTEAKWNKWLMMKNSKERNSDPMNRVKSTVQELMERQPSTERPGALFAVSSESNEGIVEPEVHRPFAKGLASILTSLTAITKFPRRQEATAASKEESTVRQAAVEASTSGAQRSILREKGIEGREDSSGFLKMRQFWWWYPPKKTKKSIIFVDANSSEMSDGSSESVVTLIGKPLKSALRSTTGSLPSGNSSVRFSLPEVPSPREKSLRTLRIGKWDIVCEATESTEGWIATWRSLRRTRLCKIVVCLALGVIVPSLLVVPVLVYEDSSVVATFAA